VKKEPVSTIEQFVITGNPTDLRPLHDLLASDPETAVISVAPQRLVIAMDADRIGALATAFGSRFQIEEDVLLTSPEVPHPE
jgi:hypothetical protein